MAGINGPKIVTSGLVFCANAADKKSYIGSGTSWRDLTQYSVNGTLNGGITFSSNNGGYLITGAYNSGKYFDWGTGLSQVNFTSGDFTVSIMFLPNSGNFGGGQIGLFGYGRVFVAGYYMMLGKTATNKLSFFTNGSGGGANQQETRSSDFSVYSGKWTLLTITRTGSSVKIYANTTDITETAGTHSNPISNTTFPLVLANTTEGGTAGSSFDGYFTSYMIYNKVLSASEISRNFDSMRRRFSL